MDRKTYSSYTWRLIKPPKIPLKIEPQGQCARFPREEGINSKRKQTLF